MFAPKKDGTILLCVEYGGLNFMTVRDAYRFSGWMSVSTAWWGKDLQYSGRELKVLTDPELSKGTRQYNVCNTLWYACVYAHDTRTKNAPATCQRATDTIPITVEFQLPFVYLDYVIIF